MSDTMIRVNASTRFNYFRVDFDYRTYGCRSIQWGTRENGRVGITGYISFDRETGEVLSLDDNDFRDLDAIIRDETQDQAVIYEWLAVFTAIYNSTGFLDDDNNVIPLNVTGVLYADTVDDVPTYGGWQPFDLRTRDDWRRRKQLIADGAEASGLSLNYVDLPVVNDIKLIPGAKWITNIFYDDDGDNEAWFDTVGNVVHREEAVRNYFVHNGGRGTFTVKDNNGKVIEKIPSEHSADIRVVREKDGRNNAFVVIREADHHLDVRDTGTADRRRHELLIWARQGLRDLQATEYDPLTTSLSKLAYAGLIFNTMVVGTQSANLTDDAVWARLSSNMVNWDDFNRFTTNIRTFVDSNDDGFYGTNVVILYENNALVLARSSTITPTDATVPIFGLGDGDFRVKKLLGYSQSLAASDPSLSNIFARVGNIIATFYTVPDFDPEITDYRINVVNLDSIDLFVETTHPYAVAGLPTNPVNLDPGDNTFRIHVTSQDGRFGRGYTVVINRRT